MHKSKPALLAISPPYPISLRIEKHTKGDRKVHGNTRATPTELSSRASTAELFNLTHNPAASIPALSQLNKTDNCRRRYRENL
jgi:hypothetical protein